MKGRELRQHTTCDVCRRRLGETPLPIFWTVKAARHGLNADAIRRQDGLTSVLGGNAAIAAAMGPDEDMTVTLMGEVGLTVCDQCATSSSFSLLMVVLARRSSDK